MLHGLICHPDTPSAAVDRIDVAIARQEPGLLALRYTVSGRIASISLAPPSEPLRTDELWRTTCCEAFVETMPRAGYYEFNLSPSSKWAAYHFTDYRAGMALAELSPPAIITGANATHIDVDALIYLPASDEPWQLALTAVIEETNGVKSYWALKHPAGKPDFHHADGFVRASNLALVRMRMELRGRRQGAADGGSVRARSDRVRAQEFQGRLDYSDASVAHIASMMENFDRNAAKGLPRAEVLAQYGKMSAVMWAKRTARTTVVPGA